MRNYLENIDTHVHRIEQAIQEPVSINLKTILGKAKELLHSNFLSFFLYTLAVGFALAILNVIPHVGKVIAFTLLPFICAGYFRLCYIRNTKTVVDITDSFFNFGIAKNVFVVMLLHLVIYFIILIPNILLTDGVFIYMFDPKYANDPLIRENYKNIYFLIYSPLSYILIIFSYIVFSQSIPLIVISKQSPIKAFKDSWQLFLKHYPISLKVHGIYYLTFLGIVGINVIVGFLINVSVLTGVSVIVSLLFLCFYLIPYYFTLQYQLFHTMMRFDDVIADEIDTIGKD